jgi:uncharacterized protein (TIGR03083 family)
VTEPTADRTWISALRRSHDRLVAVVDAGAPTLTGPSYCRDWTVAQVLSHLGSGAEIFSMFLEAGLAGTEPPARESFPPIWDSWNGRPPQRQARDSLDANAALVERFESLDERTLTELRLSLFGMELDAAGLGRMRISEHAIHTWDVAVMADSAATIAPDAVGLLVDNLSQMAQRTGRASDRLRVEMVTAEPARRFVLAIGDTVDLTEVAAAEAGAAVHLPAEALVRLVYGRLDPAHTPNDITVSGLDFDLLRQVFPGF